jgi:hypothetical protein
MGEGFRFVDLEHRTPVTPNTVFHLASITKTFAATLILQLVEEGKLDLDEPMSHYSSDFKDDSVTIKHLLTHTSQGTPGERFQYSGNRYGYLKDVIEKKYGKPFLNVVVETSSTRWGCPAASRITTSLSTPRSGGPRSGKIILDRYQQNISRLSPGYTLYGDHEIIRVPYPLPGTSARRRGFCRPCWTWPSSTPRSTGTVFLKKDTQEKAWTAFVSNSGERLRTAWAGSSWITTDSS